MLRKLVLIVAEAVAIVLVWTVITENPWADSQKSISGFEKITRPPYPDWTLIDVKPNSVVKLDGGGEWHSQEGEYLCLERISKMLRYPSGDYLRVFVPSISRPGWILLENVRFTSELCPPLYPVSSKEGG